jgi:hypothetical protein
VDACEHDPVFLVRFVHKSGEFRCEEDEPDYEGEYWNVLDNDALSDGFFSRSSNDEVGQAPSDGVGSEWSEGGALATSFGPSLMTGATR